MNHTITIAIIICALGIAFVEKKYLFSKPFTGEKALVLILLLGTALFSWIKETSNNSQADKMERNSDSLMVYNRILVAGNGFLNKQIDSLRKDSKDYHLNTVEALAGYGFQEDSINKTLIRLSDKVKGETPPTLTILYPPTIEKLNNERTFNFALNALNSDVHILGYYYVYIKIKNRKPIDTPTISPGGTINQTGIIPAGADKWLCCFVDRIQKRGDSFYIAMEYTYKSKSNKIQTPLRKIYEVELSPIERVVEVDNQKFDEVSLYLKRMKIWKKFYNL